MAHAVLAPAYGAPEVLEVREVDPGEPGPGEVAIEVRAAALNPADRKIFSGAFGQDEDALPRRIGFEAAGVVTETGANAEGPSGPIAVGDEVICYIGSGAQASHLVVAGGDVFRKPAGISFEEAAGLTLTGVTAVHLLEATHVGRGDTVLVHGGSGGVGLSLVQLAVARGASVVATAGARAHVLLAGYGVRPTVYGDGLLRRARELAPAGYDVALDCVGTDEAIDVSLALVSDRDRIASIAAFGRADSDGFKILGGEADPGTEVRARARMQLVEAVEAGRLQVTVARSFPLGDAGRAHRFLAEEHPNGKVVLVP